ncbi:MAG: phenylacetate--CoA ligase family protein [Candidatus Nanohalobium sp.]
MGDDVVVEDEFVSSSLGVWEKRETEDGTEYTKNGIPRSEEAYQAAKASALPDDGAVSPYDVVDFSEEEVDEFAEDPADLSSEELEALKDVKTAYTVRHAYENSDFYREVFDENGVDPYEIEGIEDLGELPVIDGDDVLANQPPSTRGFRLENPGAKVRRVVNTSGSTGNPKEFKKSYDEMDEIADQIARGFRAFGMEEGDRIVNYLPFVGMNASGVYLEAGFEELGMTSFPISNTPYPTEVEANKLRMYSPSDDDVTYAMVGLPSHIDSKGKKFQEAGFEPSEFGIDVIDVGGEPVSESRKESIEETFDAEVYESLGTTESGVFTHECKEDADRLHVLDDSVHVEILDPETGERVEEGEEGSLNVTNLLHPGEESAMPVIRYNLGDLTSEYEEVDCGCGYQTGVDIKPPRRDSWSFVVGAVNLDPTFFEDNIFDHPELSDVTDDYQLQVDYDRESGSDTLDVLIASQEEDYIGEEAQFRSDDGTLEIEGDQGSVAEDIGRDFLKGHSHLEDTVSVGGAMMNVEIVDDIEMDKGKPQRLIDKRDI